MGGLTGLRVASRLLLVGVLIASGGYVLVYLYRWEWNRALMAGVFFLAAEIALVGAALASRMLALENREHRLGSRVPDLPPAGGGAPAPTVAPEARRPPARGPFAWLEETSGGFGVFIPILLGAGVILSMIAWVVERLARFVTAPASGTGPSSPYAALDLPAGGLVAVGGSAGAPPRGLDRLEAPRPPVGRVVLHWAVTLGSVAGLLVGIWFLREAAESRPGGGGAGTTTVELEISTRESGATTEQLVDALWVACRLRLPRDAEMVAAEVPAPGRAVLAVSPALGETDRRQFTGCLGDTVLDRVDADITRVETTAGRPAPIS
jgi:hypothetical protein